MKFELAFYLNPMGSERRTIMMELADFGIKTIGIDGQGWNSGKDRAQIKKFLGEMDESGLNLYSMHSTCPILASSQQGTPPDLLEIQLKELETFSMLGGKTVVYHACYMRDADNIDANIELIGWEAFVAKNAETLKILARKANESGISIVLENIWRSCHAKSVSGFLDIIHAVDEKNIGVILDSGHSNLAGLKVADEIRLAGDLLLDTHFHDNAGAKNGHFFDQHIPPGLGTIDWQDVISALIEIDYSNPIFFEGVLGPGDSVEKNNFGGHLSHRDIIEITIKNWRAFEFLVDHSLNL